MADDIKCPICGSKTRLRISKKNGRKFNVCVNYPECKGRVAVHKDWGDDWDEEIHEEGWTDEERSAAETAHEWAQQQSSIESRQLQQTPSKHTGKRERGSPLMILGILGLFLCIGSICVLVYYWGFFDTTVPVSGLEEYGVSRVTSLELRRQQQTATAFCGLLIALSVFGMVVGYKARGKKSD